MTVRNVSVGGRDFFAAQRRLRWQSALLMAGLFLLLWVIVNWLSGIHMTKTCTTASVCETTYDLSISGLVVTALVVAAYLVVGPLLTSHHLVAGQGARPADGSDAVVFRNVVGEIAIASGVPVPGAFIVDDPSLNAYAISDGRRHGAVIVTSGLLAALDRRELSGVVAHELAHIRNRDSRVMLVTVYAVAPIILAATIAGIINTWLITRFRGPRPKSIRGLAALFVIVAATLAAIFRFIAVPAALLLRAALSRHREELADASAVQYTRDPGSLRAALEKIAAADNAPHLPLLARALCITEPHGPPSRPGIVERWMQQHPSTVLGRWVTTHPPIEERIAWLRSLEGALGAGS